ncbi:pimeloyl-ACP methyl ester carboxylesterase [Streptomyces sp. Ag82_O1-15]|uniref:alpha/beta fold hydrolase n=1 Tax=Streptomyces sp. Ag82_O1-15 TaxID=1938855 RepID=UPI000BB119BC|nr:alpha/beta fold hydrolase [Streptomyces sp. Ag82_O1-15]PBC92482.1 pimeloyl-ACP methyl ester carboxylesterase [Streptomyces sp. Ag82_O1-15]
MKTERVADTDVRYRRTGDGDLAVVFVHGFLDDQYVWDRLIPQLATPGIECITLDLAGCGDRAAADGPYDYDRFAAEAGAAVDALGKPFVIVGHSMGAAVAELVAVQRPDRARGLVLVTPVPLAGVHLPDEMIEQFRSLGGNEPGQRGVRENLSAAFPPAELDRLVATGTRLRPEVLRALAECWNTGHPQGEDPSACSGPVLIVRGEGDGFVTESMVHDAIAPRFTDVTAVSVAEAGHWAHIEQAAEVAGHLDRLLAGVLGSEAAPVADTTAPRGWTNAFAQKSATAFGEAFTEDVVLEASVLLRPVEGRDQVKKVMGAASAIYESLRFTRESVDGPRSYLEWEATAFGGLPIEGVTLLTRNADDQILRAAIHHRPLGAALRFSAELRDRLAGEIDSDHFHQG